jgi:hypothetical protein
MVNVERVQESCWVMPKGSWIASGQFLKSFGKLLRNAQMPPISQQGEGRTAQWLLAKTWQFPSLSFKVPHFLLHLLKAEEAVKNFKNAKWFFSYFCSFQLLLAKLKLVQLSL